MEKDKMKDNNINDNGIRYKRESIIKWILKQSYNIVINGYYEGWTERLYIAEIDKCSHKNNNQGF